ncbi:DUF4271 domain-containing protein [Neolewinella aurantiaca]|uniref:DUF4271 domain-containing protein n=1 Tax=Neolewinella aurantiaca TaxID=2602767 RepID=A0A5C7FW36_9BACT|nr:DUF4271 domain-containing protein [Neolewinella aurantiaca]TXF90594.1 DUF4271 domain-containing protein [Neolewinella aurantiaca]
MYAYAGCFVSRFKDCTFTFGIYISLPLRYLIILCSLMCLSASLFAQGERNPFELTARLPAETAGESTDSVNRMEVSDNPFDLRPAGFAPSTSPAPASAPGRGATADRQNGPLVIQTTDPNKGKGSILAIHVMLLITLSGLWLLFGDLLRQCFRATMNDGIMNQLYTRRSGGELGALWTGYIYFFLASGFFVYLFATNFEIGLSYGIWGSWLTCSLVVAAALGIKNIVLVLFSFLFPVRKEVSRYVFALMIFAILGGVLISPVNLLISYAPVEWRTTFLYCGAGILVGIYCLHLMRGLFIGNRLFFSRPVHFLLYICAVELAPLLLVYYYVSGLLP